MLVLKEGLTQAEVANLCNVTPALVCKLVKTVKQAKYNYDIVNEKKDQKQKHHEVLVSEVREYIETGRHLWNAE